MHSQTTMPTGTVRVIAALLLIVSFSLNTNVHNSNNQFALLFVQGAAAAATNRSQCGATVPMPFSTNLMLADVSSTSSSTLFTIGCVAQSPAVSWGVSKDEATNSNFAAADHRTPVVLTEISYSSSSTTVHMWDSEKLQWMDDHTTTIPNKIARSALPFVEAVTDPSTNKTVVNFFVLMLNELHGVLSLHANDRPHFALTVPGNFPDAKYDARTFGSGMIFMAYSNALSGVFVADTANRCLRYVQVFEVLPEPVNGTSAALRSVFPTSPAQIVDVTNAGVCSGSTTPPTTGRKEVRLVAPTALAVANAHDASQGVFLWDYSARTLFRVLSPNLRRTRDLSALDFSNTRLYEVTSLAATTGGADAMLMPYCSVCNTPGRFSSIDDRLVLSHTEFGYLSRLQLTVKDSGLPLGVNRSDCQGVRDTGVLCIMVSSPGEVQQLTVPESTEAVQSAASGASPPLTGSHGNISSHGWWSVVKDVSEGACVWNTYEMTPVGDCPILSAQFITARAGDGSKPPASRMWNDFFPVSLLLRNNSANQIAANPSSGLIPSEVYTTNLTNCANATVSFDGDDAVKEPGTPTPTEQVAAGTEFCCVMPLMGSPPIKINLDGGTEIVAVDYVKDYYSGYVDFSSEGMFLYVQQLDSVGPDTEKTYRMQRYNFSTMVNKVVVDKNPSMMATKTKITSIGAGMPSEPMRGYGSAGGIYAFSFDSLTPSAAPIIGSANDTFGLPPLFGGQWVSLFSQHEYQTFLVDKANHCLRLVVGRTISTIAGVCGTPGSNDGVGSAARFENPYAITGWPSSSVTYIADDNGIRAVTAGAHTGSDFSVATIWRSPTFMLTSGLDIRSIGIVTDIPHLTFALGSPCALRFANVSASENGDKLYLLRQYKCCALRAIVPGRGFLGAESTALFASIIMGYQAQGTEALVETWHASTTRAQVILAGDYCPVTTPPSTPAPDTLAPDTPSPPLDSDTPSPSDTPMPTTDSSVPTSPPPTTTSPPEDTNSAQHEVPTTTSDEPPNTTTLIVALSCVGVVVVVAIAALFAWHFRKQHGTKEDEATSRGAVSGAVSGGKLSRYAVSSRGRDGATTFNDDGQEMESVDTAPALSHSQMATRGNFTTLGDMHSPQLTLNDADHTDEDEPRQSSPLSRNDRRGLSLATPTDTDHPLQREADVNGVPLSQRGVNNRESSAGSGSTPLMTTISRSQLNAFNTKGEADDTLNGSSIDEQRKLKRSANRSSLGAVGDMTNNTSTNSGSRMIGSSAANHNDSDRDVITCIKDGSYIKVQLIGRGGYGSVYSCLLNNGSLVAMKEMLLPHSLDREASFVEDVEVEMNIVSSLHHPNVIRYYGCRLEEAESKLLLFMELVSGGSLAALTRKTSDALPEEVAKRYLQQVLEGLHHVHQCGAVHRDLKCDNVLLTTDGICKLCDFGTSKVMSNTTGGATMAAQTMIGTPLFMAPEMLLDATTLSGSFDEEDENGGGTGTKQDGYTKKADIWSFGILALELLNKGQPPWPSFVNQGAAFLHIASEKGKPRVPARLSGTCKAFIARATERNPSLRATAAELLQDPWLTPLQPNDTASNDANNVTRNDADGAHAAVVDVVMND